MGIHSDMEKQKSISEQGERDRLVTGMSDNREVRIYFVDSTQTVECLRKLHDASPMSTMILGRMATAALLMGMMSKIDETVTLQIKGSGEMKSATAIANNHGMVKVSSPYTKLESRYTQDARLDVQSAVGQDGTLSVVRDNGKSEPFVGQVNLFSGGIAEDLAHYFAQSEQISTAVELGVKLSAQEAKVKASGGILIQLLPGATEETISYLEKVFSKKESVSALLDKGLDISVIAREIMGELGLNELESYPVRYECACSREQVEDLLYSLGSNELQAMIDEDGGAKTICHYCNTERVFTVDDLQRLIRRRSMN